MKISTKGRYALRMMIDLAVYGDENRISLKDISVRQEISVKYLEQIAAVLTKAGYITGTRGAQGGYMLARAPADYRVGDILRITEHSLAPVTCLEDGSAQCARCDSCPTVGFWKGLYQAITDYVDSVTLEDMTEEQRQLGGNAHVI